MPQSIGQHYQSTAVHGESEIMKLTFFGCFLTKSVTAAKFPYRELRKVA